MAGFGKQGEVSIGNEKFCMSLNLSGQPGFGIKERGDDWKGPIAFIMSGMVNRPMYLPFASSLFIISSNFES